MAVQLFAIINVKNSRPGTHPSKIAAAKEPEKNNAKEYTVNRSLALQTAHRDDPVAVVRRGHLARPLWCAIPNGQQLACVYFEDEPRRLRDFIAGGHH
jgi:hypothetical protein